MRLLLFIAVLVIFVAALPPRHAQGSQRIKREDVKSSEVTPETHPQFFYGNVPRLSYIFRKEIEEEDRTHT